MDTAWLDRKVPADHYDSSDPTSNQRSSIGVNTFTLRTAIVSEIAIFANNRFLLAVLVALSVEHHIEKCHKRGLANVPISVLIHVNLAHYEHIVGGKRRNVPASNALRPTTVR